MRAVITVVGKDMVGILAKVSALCSECNVNVIEVSQSILQDMFCMIMLVDMSKINTEFAVFSDRLSDEGKEMNLVIHVMHEDVFNTMHHI
jgi:ACT domain-containing protein